MASKYPDVYAGTVGGDRDIQRQVTCTFVASGSGSYYSRSCHNLAAWVQVYHGSDGKTYRGDYWTLRCHRHRAIDERTAMNRGWGHKDYEPFDGAEVARTIRDSAAALAEAQRLDKVNAQVAASVTYILNHAQLTPDQKAVLTRIGQDSKANILVVK